jgi:hypothetical protein
VDKIYSQLRVLTSLLIYGAEWLRIALSKWSTRLGTFLASRRKHSRFAKRCASKKLDYWQSPKPKTRITWVALMPPVSVAHPHADNVRTVHISSCSSTACPNYTATLLIGKIGKLCKFRSLTPNYSFAKSFVSNRYVIFGPWRLCLRYIPNSLIKHRRLS